MRCIEPKRTPLSVAAPETAAVSATMGPSWRVVTFAAMLAGTTGWLAGCASQAPTAPQERAPQVRPPARPLVPPAGDAARTWSEYKVRTARRIVDANPHMSYTGAVPEPLLAIPVLEIELKSDGHIAKIDVLRQPSQAKDTTQLAIDAVKRAAPFGDVSRLPKPWKFTEAFLFNDDRHFKPRTLDQ